MRADRLSLTSRWPSSRAAGGRTAGQPSDSPTSLRRLQPSRLCCYLLLADGHFAGRPLSSGRAPESERASERARPVLLVLV